MQNSLAERWELRKLTRLEVVQMESASPSRFGVAFLLLLAAAAGIWSLLGRMDDDVAWLTVEAPGHAVAGEALPLRVQVTGLKEPSQLAINLHGAVVRDGANDFLAPGGAKAVGKEGGRFDFEIMVHPRTDLHFVNAILFLSPRAF